MSVSKSEIITNKNDIFKKYKVGEIIIHYLSGVSIIVSKCENLLITQELHYINYIEKGSNENIKDKYFINNRSKTLQKTKKDTEIKKIKLEKHEELHEIIKYNKRIDYIDYNDLNISKWGYGKEDGYGGDWEISVKKGKSSINKNIKVINNIFEY